MKLSRLILSSLRRAGESKRFSRFVVGNVNHQPLTGRPQYLNFSRRFWTSTHGNKSPHPLPAKTSKSWRSFLICASAVLGGMALLFPSNKDDEVTGSIDVDQETKSEKKLKKWILLYIDHFNSSPDVRASQEQKVVDAFKILGSKQIKIRAMFLTIDPGQVYISRNRSLEESDSRVMRIFEQLVNVFKKVEEGDNMYLMINWRRGLLKSIDARNGADELAEAIMEVVCEDDDDEDSNNGRLQ